MPKKYYLDTSIWRDYFENRSNGLRPLGDWAFELIKMIIRNKDIFLYSDVVIQELRKKYSDEDINKIFAVARADNLLERTEATEIQVKEARALSKQRKVPFHDALHAVLTRDNNAVLIARDKHFLELDDIVMCKKPEEII